MSWHGETRGNKGGFFRCFLPTPLTDWAYIFTGLLFDIEVVVHKVWALDNTVYRKGPMALSSISNCQRRRTRWTHPKFDVDGFCKKKIYWFQRALSIFINRVLIIGNLCIDNGFMIRRRLAGAKFKGYNDRGWGLMTGFALWLASWTS